MNRAERIKRFGLLRTVWRRLLQLQQPVLGFRRFECLVLPPGAAQTVTPPAGISVKEVPLSELEPFVGGELTRKTYASALEARDLCVGVFDGRQLASFSLNTARAARFSEVYRFVVPEGWMYHYMAVTMPAWRGRRLHAFQMPFLLGCLNQRSKGIVTLVETINYSSLRSFRRQGFRSHCSFSFIGPDTKQRLVQGKSSHGFAFEH